ncbi:prolipoprotein diacylglyceryl transferase [Rhodohalobacter sp. SW132]|uniref:prolipoprotein diacylglyceryl transferase n=1 Tax=Rhodohalobacter sp. SW132 TaxID=2293433 RepID=UPI0018F38ABD|nr:prolipoprotein diacylglyceryl transferase [Rhodohalobacter sp. SW132]
MNSSNHLTWGPSPEIFTIPEFYLPFSVSIFGLILTAILFYLGWQKIKPPKGEHMEEPWKGWALGAVAFIVGQIPFLFIGSPTLDTIGPLEPRWYGLLFASAFIFGYMITYRMFSIAGRSQEDMDRLLIYVLIATVIGARLGHVIFYDLDYYMRNIHLVPQVWTGGLASHGAAIGIIIAMYLYVKKTPGMTFFWLADRVVPAVAIGGMFIRIGNFMNSEILGKASDLPWAVIFEVSPHLTATERAIPRHPSMLYEALLCLVVLGVLWSIYKKYQNRPPEGSLFATFLVMLFTGRFLIEFTKLAHSDIEATWTLNMGQWLSIPLVAYGIWVLVKQVNWSKQGK